MLLTDVGDDVVFEAPRPPQQAWFVRRLGAAANLANIAASEVASVEALRLGLRTDTARVAVDAERRGPWW